MSASLRAALGNALPAASMTMSGMSHDAKAN